MTLGHFADGTLILGCVSGRPERLDVGKRIPKTEEECGHYARYAWASALVPGEALDVACGTGYRARLLAHHARVSGVDRDEAAVSKARLRATGSFSVAEVPPIPFPNDAFDFVACFETIEHIPDDTEFIREIRRVLRPGGTLLISTPNKAVSAPGGVPLNKWHVREYTLATLKAFSGEPVWRSAIFMPKAFRLRSSGGSDFRGACTV